jgi:hypothetical protein
MAAAEEIPSSCFFSLQELLLLLLSFAKAQDIRRLKPCNPIIIIFCFLLYYFGFPNCKEGRWDSAYRLCQMCIFIFLSALGVPAICQEGKREVTSNQLVMIFFFFFFYFGVLIQREFGEWNSACVIKVITNFFTVEVRSFLRRYL